MTGSTPAALARIAGLRREAQLLLCCARTALDADARQRAADLLSKDLDWKFFLDLVTTHRVISLVHRGLDRAQLGSVPAAIMTVLEQQLDRTARRNLMLTGRLVEVLRMLEAERIRAIPYKGIAIAAVASGAINLRQFSDLDLLVHPRDYSRTRDLLLSRGYRLREDYGWECLLVDATGVVLIDLHRDIAPDVWPGSLWFDGLWKRRERIASLGGIQTLSGEDLLVALIVQLRKDAAYSDQLRLNKICDIAELLRARPTLDWKAVSVAARRLGCQRALSLALAVARELLGAPADKASLVRVDVDPAQIQPLVDYVCNRLFAEGAPTSVSPMSHQDFHFQARERWRDRLYAWYSRRARRWVMDLQPSAKDRAMVSLPIRLGFLYYLVRPIRVGRDYARSWFKDP